MVSTPEDPQPDGEYQPEQPVQPPEPPSPAGPPAPDETLPAPGGPPPYQSPPPYQGPPPEGSSVPPPYAGQSPGQYDPTLGYPAGYMPPAESKGSGWLKGLGITCGVLVAGSFIVVFGFVIVILGPCIGLIFV